MAEETLEAVRGAYESLADRLEQETEQLSDILCSVRKEQSRLERMAKKLGVQT